MLRFLGFGFLLMVGMALLPGAYILTKNAFKAIKYMIIFICIINMPNHFMICFTILGCMLIWHIVTKDAIKDVKNFYDDMMKEDEPVRERSKQKKEYTQTNQKTFWDEVKDSFKEGYNQGRKEQPKPKQTYKKSYFNANDDLNTLKMKYRQYAKTMHPDRGGNADEFIKMKNEYDYFKSRA